MRRTGECMREIAVQVCHPGTGASEAGLEGTRASDTSEGILGLSASIWQSPLLYASHPHSQRRAVGVCGGGDRQVTAHPITYRVFKGQDHILYQASWPDQKAFSSGAERDKDQGWLGRTMTFLQHTQHTTHCRLGRQSPHVLSSAAV